ncbi:MAG: DNA polymerase III subunit beta [Epulopiscium sp. Nuni2H_MBin001]|nr:MAG: DNA polymerase III subunit beta [Epulopiscium sp. Nuni2H_MBin001]
MKIYCNQKALMSCINTVIKASSTRTSLPILECILINANSNYVTLTTNNLDLGIESTFEADVITNGLIALEAKLLSEIIKKMPNEEIEINLLENNYVSIASGKSKFTIVARTGEDFPALPKVQVQKGYTIPRAALKDMINQTIFSVASDESRPAFMGEMFHIKDNTFNLVSVDGFRISYRQAEIVNEFGEIESIVPAKALAEIARILPHDDGDVIMYFDNRHVFFDIENTKIVSRLLEGEFLKYSQMFTPDYDTQIIVNCKELLMCIERASVISREGKKHPICLEINTEQMIIKSNTDFGTSIEELNADIQGKNLTIAFNPRYLMDALKAIEDDEIMINFLSIIEPCIIQPKNGNAYKYLILPIRVNA